MNSVCEFDAGEVVLSQPTLQVIPMHGPSPRTIVSGANSAAVTVDWALQVPYTEVTETVTVQDFNMFFTM
jgi:hypothetical protein